MQRFIRTSLIAAAACLAAMSANAAEFPADKPVTIVVPFSAGGPTDKVVRDLALSMARSLGQSVMVENVVGAGGTIGSRKVASAPKDGYVVLVHTMGMATAPSLYKGLDFHALKDFDYIGQIVDVPMVILGSKKLPAENFPALLEHIRAHPGQVSIGHAGPGSAAHLCTLLFASALKAELVSVAYKGSAPALSDLIGGQIDLVCDQTTSTAGQIKAGTVRPYAVTTLNRASPFDDMPTAHEQGLKGFDVKTWHGMYAPKGLPPAVRDKLVAALKASVQDPAFKQKMTDLGAQVVSAADASPESLEAKLTSETALWGKVIKASGIKPN
jgi:tripartite-type tricarboxylate transporter receptor subunit TctC